MAHMNPNFLKLTPNYLFSEIATRVGTYLEIHPKEKLIRLGIGDVTRPLVPAVVEAMASAVAEQGRVEGFHGYGPEQGYSFLRELISLHDYGGKISPEEIFIGDGAKSDCGNFGELFDGDSVVAVCDPVYPVYADTTILSGKKIQFIKCVLENSFTPIPGRMNADLIWLCSPNNPTGMALSRSALELWVSWANRCGAVLLFDGAYEAFITDSDIPHSIYEIPGAKTCAVEFRSFSKTAGFTGTRCAYTVVPKELERDGIYLRELWNRRQCTKFNGVSYMTQRGAAAVYSEDGRGQIRENITYYHRTADILRSGLKKAGLTVYGGVNAPYLWVETPGHASSWSTFDRLLREAQVVVTPGIGFGLNGEGYIRLTAFGSGEDATEAVERICRIL